ncbi:site-specific DNA-methyltransferase, partial [bacterium]|nr:site-specific DNA-methyltransferase [bacterium]
FFSRYYDDGDFLSKRRYSRREKYAVPYNGEEVYLHWANNDQYYVKTGEYFNDYRFKSPYGISIHFMLVVADVEKDNIKGDKRFFVPVPKEVTFDTETKEITIPFQYRPLTEQEDIKYGQRNQQDTIITEALNEIPAELQKDVDALPSLISTHHATSDGQVSLLEHHLRRYTRRNTSDFFVHKDLKGFLTRELDFYLKNEVLNLDEVEAAGEPRSEAWFQIMHIIRSIGSRGIEFLAQIEDFQKRLFEKKKFILETQYCITMANVPEDFYAEIAECEAQWQEWEDLFHLNEEKRDIFSSNTKNKKELRVSLLKTRPTLALDTKHFSQDFSERLLASLDNLDEKIDCLLVHGENLQALNLLLERYHEKISCIHIDPPYNTQTSGFLYKNDYQHSSWLAMMEDRIKASISVMSQDGSYLCHIDENEYERLQLLFERFPVPDAGTVAWDKRNPMNAGRGIATQHEYIIWRSRRQAPIYLRNKNIITMLKKATEIVNKHGIVSKEAQREYAAWINSNSELSGGEKAYRYLDKQGCVYRGVSLRAPEPRTNPKFHIPLIHPATKKPCPVPPNGFSRTPETLQEMIEKGEIIFGPDESTQPQQKRYLTEESRRQISSIIQDGRKGKADLAPLGLDFPYCHPVSLYEGLIGAATQSLTDSDIVLDHFAGSGTSGHAVINLNREDRSRRKFILVEMDDYFDTVLIPRIKKVTYTPEWKNGKPARLATADEAEYSPRIMKYICLESYEDTLNNITFPDVPKTLYDFDDYLLKYMLAWETKESETLLNVDKIASPFSYKLTIADGEEMQQKPVDIPETFAYLLGLN